MKDVSDDSSHYKQTLLPRVDILLPGLESIRIKQWLAYSVMK